MSNRKIFDGATKTNEAVNELRAMIDQGIFDPIIILMIPGKIINYSKYSEVDVALLLKLFLKKLPDPLFPTSSLSLMGTHYVKYTHTIQIFHPMCVEKN